MAFSPGSVFAFIGRVIIDFLSALGRFALFLLALLRELIPGFRYTRHIFDESFFIGNQSFPLVFLTSLFVGGVSALQTAFQFQGTLPLFFVGTVITKSVFIELGPVLTALVVGARVSSSFAAEIGTMRVTEQIDALETLAIRPIRYLAVPRFVAAVATLPAITVLAEALALMGGFLVAVSRVGISAAMFTRGMKFLFDPHEIYGGLIKSFVFGGIIAVSGCFFGFETTGGAEGVGESTTKAVVMSCVLILVADYFLAEVVFRVLFPAS